MSHQYDIAKAIDTAKKRRDSLAVEIKQLDVFIQAGESLLNDIIIPLEQIANRLGSDNLELSAKSANDIPAERFKNMSIGDATAIILRESAKPLKANIIIEKLRAGGYENPKITSLYPTLKRRKEFRKVKPGVFGLAEWKKTENAPLMK